MRFIIVKQENLVKSFNEYEEFGKYRKFKT